MEKLKELVGMIGTLGYREEASKEAIAFAKENGIVIVWGESDDLLEERENMQDVLFALEEEKRQLKKENAKVISFNDTLYREKQQAVKDTAKKFADLVEFHSISHISNGVENFTISALGLKEILTEEFGFKYSELDYGVEVE
jgi:hypothetical protein